MASSYRDLLVWQKAKTLAVELYRATDDFPRREIYGLVAQMRRAVVSIASNVAEGQGRVTSGEFKQFLGHARGSLLELETQMEIANELGFWDEGDFVSISNRSRELRYLLNRLISSLSPSDGPNTASTTGVIGSDKRRMSSGRRNRRDATSETSETFETSDTI